MQRVVQALIQVLLVCLGVRLAAWLIAPILPALGFLVILAAVTYWFFSGPRARG